MAWTLGKVEWTGKSVAPDASRQRRDDVGGQAFHLFRVIEERGEQDQPGAGIATPRRPRKGGVPRMCYRVHALWNPSASGRLGWTRRLAGSKVPSATTWGTEIGNRTPRPYARSGRSRPAPRALPGAVSGRGARPRPVPGPSRNLNGVMAFLIALVPSIGVLFIFWIGIRALVQADRRERAAQARIEAAERRDNRGASRAVPISPGDAPAPGGGAEEGS